MRAGRSGVEIDPVPPGLLFYGKLFWPALLQNLSITTTPLSLPFPFKKNGRRKEN